MDGSGHSDPDDSDGDAAAVTHRDAVHLPQMMLDLRFDARGLRDPLLLPQSTRGVSAKVLVPGLWGEGSALRVRPARSQRGKEGGSRKDRRRDRVPDTLHDDHHWFLHLLFPSTDACLTGTDW